MKSVAGAGHNEYEYGEGRFGANSSANDTEININGKMLILMNSLSWKSCVELIALSMQSRWFPLFSSIFLFQFRKQLKNPERFEFSHYIRSFFLCNRERFIMLRFLQSVEIIWNCQSMILIFKWWAPFKQQQQNWFLCTRTYNFFFFFSLCFRFSLPSCLFFSDLYHYFYFSSC